MSFFNSIGNTFNNAFHGIDSIVNDAFNKDNHGFLDGRWEDFSLGITRGGTLLPNIAATNIQTVGHSINAVGSEALSNLTSNPSFYLLAGGGILGLLIVGYVVVKLGKYV